jgi:hypothetical protein
LIGRETDPNMLLTEILPGIAQPEGGLN